MKKILLIFLILLTGCSTKPINQPQTEKKESKTTNSQTKDSWIYQTPWGKSALR